MLCASVNGQGSTMTRQPAAMLLLACPGAIASIGRLRWPAGREVALGVVIVAGVAGCTGRDSSGVEPGHVDDRMVVGQNEDPMPAASSVEMDHRVVWNPAEDAKTRIQVTTTTAIGSDLLVIQLNDGDNQRGRILSVNGTPVPGGPPVRRADIWRLRAEGTRDSVEVETEGCAPLAISVIEQKAAMRTPGHWQGLRLERFFPGHQVRQVVARSDSTTFGLPLEVEVDTVVGVRKRIGEDILFEFDSANITWQEEQAKLQDIAKDLANWLVGDSTVTISVEGHTDQVGEEAYNHGLGLRRAESVIRELILHHPSLCSSRFVMLSHGESMPSDVDSPREARARNRRVEVVVVRDTTPTSHGATGK